MMNNLLFALLLVAAVARQTDAFKPTRCDNSTTTKLVRFSINSCLQEDKAYCEFPMGKNVQIDLEFQRSTSIASASATLRQDEGWKWTKLTNSEACGFLGLTCPTATGVTLKISDSLIVSPAMHNAMYQYVLSDGGGQFLCIEFPVRVTE